MSAGVDTGACAPGPIGPARPAAPAGPRPPRSAARWRLPFLLMALVAMLAGLDAALMLLGLPAPVTADRLPAVHGPLMVIGFVATLIALERAVALRTAAGYAAPGLLGLGAPRVTLTIEEVVREVAPGLTQQLWTYNGSMPGPLLHGRVGDVFEVTVVNHAPMGHSIDFHAGMVTPDDVMRTIPPGGTLLYSFTAVHAGIWLYHCATSPMAAHIANGMFGAVVIDPPRLPPVAHQYVLIQSEPYLGPQGGPVDVDKVDAERPDAVVFNGYADQYDARPLPARVGQRVRVWVLDAGPERATSFHIIGGQFDTVYAEGSYLLRPGSGESGGSQVLALAPAQGGFVELTFPEPGHYPFISHYMLDAQRGAHGVLDVTR